jgi:hypothetical protein
MFLFINFREILRYIEKRTEVRSCVMTEEEKKLNAQKYFINKLLEYFKNSYGILQNKRYDSLIAMFEEIIDIQDEINKSKVDTSHLLKSLDSLLAAFKYQWCKHPLIRHKTISRDLNSIINKIKTENDNDYYITIHNLVTSMKKKLNNQQIIKLYLDIIKQETLSYGEVDKLLDSFVSELLFQGYSLRYLEEWYGKEIEVLIKDDELDNNRVEVVLNIINDLACNSNAFYLIFPCNLPKDLAMELDEYKEIRINNLVVHSDDNLLNEVKEKIKLDDRLVYLSAEAIASDKYKAIEVLKNSIESYAEIYKILNQSSKPTINEKTVFYISSDKENWDKVILEDIIYINNKMVSISRRERNDIQDLAILRRSLNTAGKSCSDISIIERTLEITKNALVLSSGNKFLNIWSGLEYLSTFYYKDKIIERTRSIIPKVVSLNYLRNKINILWDRIQHYKYVSSLEFVKYCIEECSIEGNQSDYDIEKFTSFLINTSNAIKLCKDFSENIIIQREIAELNGLLQNKEDMTSILIKDITELVKQDLNRIYRLRNKLVHSGSNIPENIDVFIYRLYKYVNSLLSVLIYCIRKNPQLTITEILYSIVDTHDWCIEFITNYENKSDENLNDLVSPQFFYL